MNIVYYYNTLKYLKPIQIYGRLLYKLSKPSPNCTPAPSVRGVSAYWVAPARRRAIFVGSTRCRFLNEEHDIAESSAWDNPAWEKLWRYNLHYFDDLNAMNAKERTSWHRQLLSRWIQENPPGRGTGWEPYPSSLRIVNWLKWSLAGNGLEPEWLHSLAVQARWLARRLEVYLLGNHLFANAKALVFAGLYFDGPEASLWLDKGLTLLQREIPEQILPDGGHFERSPLYHALALEDMLDLVNVTTCLSAAIPSHWHDFVRSWPATIGHMRTWLAGLSHPDGEISFFNDAAFGVAPAPIELESYAERLGLSRLREPLESCAHFGDSGYIRVRRGKAVALLDVAPIGPDYQPGHAHADTLSFELSLFGQRVLVNSGTSHYGLGPERLRQRGTAAHNTVTIDGKDSSEVWGGFRVARRASPFGLRLWDDGKTLRILCAHDGYKRLSGKPVHWREWRFGDDVLEVVDNIEGKFRGAVSRVFFCPGVKASQHSGSNTGHMELVDGRHIRWQVEDATVRILPSSHFPEFGKAEPNLCLEMRMTGSRCLFRLTWK